MLRRTRIVATLGPATADPAVLRGLVDAGVDVVRLNLAHGSLDDHRRTAHLVREVADTAGRTVATLVDLPGPKARTGPFPRGGASLEEGQLVRLAGDGPSDAGTVAVGADLRQQLHPGDAVALGDGAVTLEVGGDGTARVVTGGRVQGRPGVATRPERVPERAPTPEDLQLVDALRGAPVDYVAVSFVRSGGDVAAVRAALGDDGPPVVSKIETAEAMDDLDAVLAASDAVMVRGATWASGSRWRTSPTSSAASSGPASTPPVRSSPPPRCSSRWCGPPPPPGPRWPTWPWPWRTGPTR